VDDAALLAALPGWAFAFALVLSRTGMAIMLMPGLGEAEPPPMFVPGWRWRSPRCWCPLWRPWCPPCLRSASAALG